MHAQAPRRLSERKLLEHAIAADDLRKQARQLEAEAKEHTEKVLAELDARGTSEAVHGGNKVTRAARRSVSYDPEKARKAWPAAVFRRTRRSTVDRDAVGREIKAGALTQEQADAVATVGTSAPWLVVTRAAA